MDRVYCEVRFLSWIPNVLMYIYATYSTKRAEGPVEGKHWNNAFIDIDLQWAHLLL